MKPAHEVSRVQRRLSMSRLQLGIRCPACSVLFIKRELYIRPVAGVRIPLLTIPHLPTACMYVEVVLSYQQLTVKKKQHAQYFKLLTQTSLWDCIILNLK